MNKSVKLLYRPACLYMPASICLHYTGLPVSICLHYTGLPVSIYRPACLQLSVKLFLILGLKYAYFKGKNKHIYVIILTTSFFLHITHEKREFPLILNSLFKVYNYKAQYTHFYYLSTAIYLSIIVFLFFFIVIFLRQLLDGLRFGIPDTYFLLASWVI